MDSPGFETVIVPLKAFDRAKSRLRHHLGDTAAAALARRLASGVVAATFPRPCLVACDDPEVEEWALAAGARVLRTSADDLNGAVAEAYRALDTTVSLAIVAHGDLLRPEGLGTTSFGPGVTVVTDRVGAGTNVLAVPAGLDFHFSYGPGSAARHIAEARRLGLEVATWNQSRWSHDVDEPSDLVET